MTSRVTEIKRPESKIVASNPITLAMKSVRETYCWLIFGAICGIIFYAGE
jgi:hypothetical protein